MGGWRNNGQTKQQLKTGKGIRTVNANRVLPVQVKLLDLILYLLKKKFKEWSYMYSKIYFDTLNLNKNFITYMSLNQIIDIDVLDPRLKVGVILTQNFLLHPFLNWNFYYKNIIWSTAYLTLFSLPSSPSLIKKLLWYTK